MQYITVYETTDPGKIPEIERLFGEEGLDYRVIRGGTNDTARDTIKVQAGEEDRKRATEILLENDFLRKPAISADGDRKSRFWIFLVLTVILIILVGFLVNWLKNSY